MSKTLGRGRNASAVSRTSGGGHHKGGGSFIPLRDLLKRNHDDRVQDYLQKMNEESADDLMNPSTAKNAAQGEATMKQK